MQTQHHQHHLPTQAHYQSPYLYNKHNAYLIDLSDDKTMSRLVASLKYVFHLNQGLELPFILGCPHCDNNDEALICWITQELKQTDWVEASHIFNFLIARLKQQLEAFHQEWM
jgi:hypothetical protein